MTSIMKPNLSKLNLLNCINSFENHITPTEVMSWMCMIILGMLENANICDSYRKELSQLNMKKKSPQRSSPQKQPV